MNNKANETKVLEIVHKISETITAKMSVQMYEVLHKNFFGTKIKKTETILELRFFENNEQIPAPKKTKTEKIEKLIKDNQLSMF